MTSTPPPTDVGQELRGRIHRGELGPGDRLPPERELATNFRVSRDRVREALLALENDGYVVARRGATGGRFVTELAAPLAAGAAQTQPQRDDNVDLRRAVE
ncbi:MAG: GntR family transcriptional regulator [Acidimicrobiia bacterium]